MRIDWNLTKVSTPTAKKSAMSGRSIEPRRVARLIEEAFRRTAYAEAARIHVATAGGIVTLSGVVNSVAARQEAERVASQVEGVTAIENTLLVGP